MTTDSGLTKNRGEWAEVMTIMGILAQGAIKTVSLVDGKLRENDAEVSVAKVFIVRNKTTIEYRIRREGGVPVEVTIVQPGAIVSVPMNECLGDYMSLKEAVVRAVENAKERTFAIPEAEVVMRKYRFGSGKSKSSLKQDVDLVLYGPDGVELAPRGFSIKSFLVSRPSLFNASRGGRFRYKIDGNKLLQAKIIEKQFADHPRAWIQNLVKALDNFGAFTYRISIPDPDFKRNLELLDAHMAEVIGYMLLQAYVCGDRSLKTGLERTVKGDPLDYGKDADTFYTYRVKHFLRAAALGFCAKEPWNGVEGAEGGMIMVRDDWSLRCFLSGKSDFENYLLETCSFETPSTSKEKWGGYATVEQGDGGGYLELLLQIRESDPFKL